MIVASIIGSFRKYYNIVKEVISVFEKNGITILSPKFSNIIDLNVEFVLFETDDPNLNEVEIELIALHRILRSDFVYVCNPNGYIGRTTCYEIGRIAERRMPLFFMEKPRDLPIYLISNCIYSPEELITYWGKSNVAASRDIP